MFSGAVDLTTLELKSAIIHNPLIVSRHKTVRDAIAQMSGVHCCSDDSEQLLCNAPTTSDEHRVNDYLNDAYLEAHASCVIVIENDRVIGILTERDVVCLSAQQQPLDRLTMQQVMTQPVVTLYESEFTDLQAAVNLLRLHRIRHLPILDEQDYLVGIVTYESLQLAITHQHWQEELEARKQAELALVASEAQSQAVLSAMPDLMFRVGADGIYRGYVSHNRERDMVPQTVNPVGLFLGDMLPPDVAQRDLEYIQRALQTGELQVYEQQVYVGDRLQDEEVRIIKSGEDEVLFIIRDITGRKQAERALKQSEQTNRIIVETLPDLLIQMDRYGNYSRMAGGSAVRVKYPSNYSPEPDVYNVLSPALAEQRLYYANQALESGNLQIYEQVFDFDDDQRYEEVRITPLNSQEVLVIIRDITDQKQAERALQQSEEKSRALLATIPDLMFRVDMNGIFREFVTNQPEINVLPTDFNPVGLAVADLVSTDIATRHYHYLEQAFRTGELQIYEQQVQMGNRLQHEEVRMVRSGDDEILCIIRDISDRKHAETALQNLIEGTAATTGQDFFPALVHHIAEALNVSYALVTEQVDDTLRTLAFWANGALQPTYSYRLTQTPCERVLQGGEFYRECSVQEAFPGDLDLVEMEVESYLGIALCDIQGNAIGHLCILNQQPIHDPKRAEQILRVFAARAAAELERQQVNTSLAQLNQELEANVEERTTALRTSEVQIRAMIEAVPDLLLRVKRDGTCLDYIQSRNQSQAGEFLSIHQHLSEVLPPELLQQQLTRIDEAIATGTLQVYEHHFQKHNRMVYEEVRIGAISADEALIMVRDITDRKQAEAELQASRAYYQGIITDQTELICRFLPDGTLTFVNDAYCQFFQKTPEELLGQSFTPLLPDEDKAIALEHFSSLSMDNPVVTYEHRVIAPDGSLCWQQWTDRALFDPDGNFIEFQAVGRDITALKEIEEALRESEQRFRSAIANAPFPIMIHAEDGEILQINTTWTELTGYTHQDIPTIQSWVQRAYGNRAADVLHNIIVKTYALQSRQDEGELTITTSDGDQHIWSFSSAPLGLIPDGRRAIISIAVDVTQRRYAEIALSDSEERYRSIYNQAAVGLVNATIEGEFLEVNPRFCEMLGYSREELFTKTVWDVTHPDDREYIAPTLQHLFADKIPSLFQEKRYLRKDGSCFWASIGISLVQDAEGNPKHTLAVIQDITDRKQAESALRESRQFIQTVLDTVPLPVFWKDLDSVFLGCNQQLSQALGLQSATEIVGKTDFDFSITEAEATAYRTDDQRVMESGDVKLGMEETLTLPNGEQRWIETNKVPLRDLAGDIVGIVGTFQDITERKHTEVHLRQLSDRLNLAVKSASIGIWDWDVMSNILVWDDRMHELYGITPEKFTGVYEGWLNGVHPDDRAVVHTAIQQALHGQKDYDIEFRVIHPDGTTRFIKASALVQCGNQGDPQRMIGVSYDITEIKEAEAAMRRQLTTIETAIDGIAIMQDDIFIYTNQAKLNLFGYEHPDDLLGKTWRLLYSQEEIDRYDREIFPVLERDRFWQGEAVAIRKDGSTFAEELSLNLTDEGLLICVCRDISDRKQAEDKVRSLLNRAQLLNRISSEIRNSLDLDIILQSSVNAIFAELPADICTFAWYQDNGEATVWEIIKEQKIPELPSWLGNHQLNAFPTLLEHILQNQLYRVDRLATLDDRPLKAFFEEMGISAYLGLPIHTAGGKIGSLQIGRISSERSWRGREIKLLQDIGNQLAIAIYQAQLYEESQAKTEKLQRSYQELKDAQLHLIQSEKMSSLGQLVAGIAHEINNPVSFIYGNLEPALNYATDLAQLIHLYQESLPNPSQAIADFTKKADIDYVLSDFPKLLTSMGKGATRIRDIVQSLRTFSRLDQADYKAVDVHENIDNALVILQNRLNGRAGNPEIQVIKHYGELPLIECYSGLLNQVFMNLLVNAIDAIEERQGDAESDDYSGFITITTAIASEHKVTISIQDNGSGMNSETQAKIFNPFFTTKPIGVGTGMGLSISYQIVTGNHEGQLQCFSMPGEGTTFIVELWKSIHQLDTMTIEE